MAKQVAEPKIKVYQAKKKEGDFSQYSNLNANVDKGTQTVSKTKLIRGILHGSGLRTGRIDVGNPVHTLDSNINLHIAHLKRNNYSQ